MISEEQPHGAWLKNGNKPFDLSTLPRCKAMSKQTGECCKQPAMANGKCHWHGGKSSGAPVGNNNALKDGMYTAEAIEQRKFLSTLMRSCKDVLKQF